MERVSSGRKLFVASAQALLQVDPNVRVLIVANMDPVAVLRLCHANAEFCAWADKFGAWDAIYDTQIRSYFFRRSLDISRAGPNAHYNCMAWYVTKLKYVGIWTSVTMINDDLKHTIEVRRFEYNDISVMYEEENVVVNMLKTFETRAQVNDNDVKIRWHTRSPLRCVNVMARIIYILMENDYFPDRFEW